MRKLANISAFESLQPQSGPNAVPDMAVFNMYPEEVLEEITRANYWWDAGAGIYTAAQLFVEELIAEHPRAGIASLRKYVDKMTKALEKTIREDPELVEVMETEGYRDEEKKDPDDTYPGTYAECGGVDGVCADFHQFACQIIERIKAGEELSPARPAPSRSWWGM